MENGIWAVTHLMDEHVSFVSNLILENIIILLSISTIRNDSEHVSLELSLQSNRVVQSFSHWIYCGIFDKEILRA